MKLKYCKNVRYDACNTVYRNIKKQKKKSYVIKKIFLYYNIKINGNIWFRN